tara:strand:+ start:3339 stop:3749 length:411 start_codon:yes stop_codon:yes gene_type:complete
MTTNTMSYASLFKKEDVEEKKKILLKPGWIMLKKKSNKQKEEPVQEEPVQEETVQEETNDINEDINKNLTALVERWQYERDCINEVYEENSPYWNEKSLLDPLSDDDLESESEEEEEENEHLMNEELDMEQELYES